MGKTISMELELQIGKALRRGMGAREAARHFGVARGTVNRIANGRSPRRGESSGGEVRPHYVLWFTCPECHIASCLKWDPGDEICFACHIREVVRLERVAQT
jgi:hypothetical protein